MKPKRKRRPEIMRPGRKQLTPNEQALVKRMAAEYRKTWEALLLGNRWREVK